MRAKAVTILVACVTALLPGVCRADLIDRVLAIVGGAVITQSDVAAALTFGLIPPPAAGTDPVAAAVDALIRRQLVLDEVTRYTTTEADAAAVAKRMDEIRARFASRDLFEAAMARTAMNEERLRGAVEANARIDAYIKQRFGVSDPSDDEVAAYFASHRPEFASGGRVLTLQEAASVVRERLIEEKRAALIDEWVARLRRRAEVTNLYFADAGR